MFQCNRKVSSLIKLAKLCWSRTYTFESIGTGWCSGLKCHTLTFMFHNNLVTNSTNVYNTSFIQNFTSETRNAYLSCKYGTSLQCSFPLLLIDILLTFKLHAAAAVFTCWFNWVIQLVIYLGGSAFSLSLWSDCVEESTVWQSHYKRSGNGHSPLQGIYRSTKVLQFSFWNACMFYKVFLNPIFMCNYALVFLLLRLL